MCRGNSRCSKLGDDANRWSKVAPLMPPDWFREQLRIFAEAVRLAANNDVVAAQAELTTIRSEELQNWFSEHGQVSGRIRQRHLGITKGVAREPRDSRIVPAKLEKEVLQRDNYLCRYCSLPLVAKSVLHAFSKLMGPESFRSIGKNLERHGIAMVFRANIDHVVPWNFGGQTVMDNLVSACQCCNYGKASFTLDQIGIDDPRQRPANDVSHWDGLTSLLQDLRKSHSGGNL